MDDPTRELTRERFTPVEQPPVGYRKAVRAALTPGGLYLADGRWRTRGIGHSPITVAARDVQRAAEDGWIQPGVDGSTYEATGKARRWARGAT